MMSYSIQCHLPVCMNHAFGKGGCDALTLYYTIQTFNYPKEKSLWKSQWKKEKMLVTSIFLLSHSVFSTLSKREIVILATLNLLTANASNLIQSKILSFGKELYQGLSAYLGSVVILNKYSHRHMDP